MNIYFLVFITLVVILVIGATVASIIMSTSGGTELMEKTWNRMGRPGAEKDGDPES